eukprot:scaffold274016_cov50-Prasinocladus_malaysianus.AAC.1
MSHSLEQPFRERGAAWDALRAAADKAVLEAMAKHRAQQHKQAGPRQIAAIPKQNNQTELDNSYVEETMEAAQDEPRRKERQRQSRPTPRIDTALAGFQRRRGSSQHNRPLGPHNPPA